MTTVYCKATGFPISVSFRRGFRLADAYCRHCRSALTAKQLPGLPKHWEHPKDECAHHDCFGKHVKGEDLGIVNERRWEGAHFVPGPPENHYSSRRGWKCPSGHTWETLDRTWSEPIQPKGGSHEDRPDPR